MRRSILIIALFCLTYASDVFSLESHSMNNENKSYQGILAITVSKSGTGLLKVILENLLEIKPIGPTANYSKEAVDELICCNQPYFFHPIEENSYRYVYDYPKAKKILTIRDPRDCVVSLIDFIDNFGTKVWPQLRLKDADWMKYNRKEKIKAILKTTHLIISFDRIDDIIRTFDNVYVCRFESLVDYQACNVETILDIASFLEIPINWNEAKEIAKNSWGSKKSMTFFKGKKGRWKEEFDEEIKMLFKQNQLNKHLLSWGYENNNEW